MANEKLEIQIAVKTAVNEAIADLKKLSSSAEDSKRKAKDAESGWGEFGKSISSGLGIGAGISAFGLLESGVEKVVDTFKEAIHEALLAEQSQKLLAGALRASGDASNNTLKEFSEYAEILSETTRVTDEQGKSLVALALNLGAPKEKIKGIVDAALDLSAAFGTDAATATEAITRALSGQSRQLASIIPEYRGLTEAQIANRDIVGELSDRYGRFAEQDITGLSGQTIQLSKAYDDFLKRIGQSITNSQAAAESTGYLAHMLNEVNKEIDNKGLWEALFPNLAKLAELAKATGLAVGNIFGKVSNEDVRASFLQLTQGAQTSLADLQQAIDTNNESEIKKEETKLSSLQLLKQSYTDLELIKKQDEALQDQVFIDDGYIRLETSLGAIEALKAIKQAKELEDEGKHREAIKLLQDKYDLADDKARKKKDEDDLKKEKNLAEAKKKIAEDLAAKQKELLQTGVGFAAAAGDAIIAVSGDSAVASLALAKGVAVAQVLIASAQARTSALAASRTMDVLAPGSGEAYLATSYGLISANLGLSLGTIAAQTIAQVSRAKASGTKGFADGGFVPGTSTRGDRILSATNSGELILSQSQQDAVAGRLSNQGSGDIIVQIDGREIARAMRNQIDQGYRFFA